MDFQANVQTESKCFMNYYEYDHIKRAKFKILRGRNSVALCLHVRLFVVVVFSIIENINRIVYIESKFLFCFCFFLYAYAEFLMCYIFICIT